MTLTIIKIQAKFMVKISLLDICIENYLNNHLKNVWKIFTSLNMFSNRELMHLFMLVT